MAIQLNSTWGPYRNETEAGFVLGRLVDRACTPTAGVAWVSNGILYPLRRPVRDKSGYGDYIVFEWRNGPAPQLQPPPRTLWQRVEAFIEDVLAEQGRAEMFVGQANLALGQQISQAAGQIYNRAFGSNAADAGGVALDVVCVAIPIVLVALTGGVGLGFWASVAAIGAVGLLGIDGTAYVMDLSGDEAGAKAFLQQMEYVRIVATIMSLPDAAKLGVNLIEAADAARLLQTDRAIMRTAGTLGKGTAEARQLIEQAGLRAQLRGQQIRGNLAYDIAPRAAGFGSAALLFNEEKNDDKSALNELWRRIQMYSITVHR